jgi:hypothetical protein
MLLFAQTTTTFSYTGNIINYTVPTGVTSIVIEAFGAQGGGTVLAGGKGAQIKGTFSVTPGEVLRILVGQKGGSSGSDNNYNGGGGGSFVVRQLNNTPLLIAGGGGGGPKSQTSTSCPRDINLADGQITNSGATIQCNIIAYGGSGGYGGEAKTYSSYADEIGGGGAGFHGDGFSYSSGGCEGKGGKSFINGGAGGYNGCISNAYGGFGGGGAGGKDAPGGGGGYSGGATAATGGIFQINASTYGGGGGSYNSGVNQLNIPGVRTGDGLVSITTLTPAGALKFDPSLAINDNSRLNYVSVNNPFEAFQKEMTVEFWMYTPNANLPFGSVMGQGDNNATTNTVWLMHPNRNGTMTFYVNDAGTLRGTTGNITANEWHHYAAVSTGTFTKFYVDGVLVHTGDGVSNSIVNNPNSVIHIGKDVRFATRHVANGDPDNRYGTMILDELRIWSRALCQEEINANKNVEINPTGQNGLQEYYRFNQGFVNANNSTVTTLTDLSGNNRNGTLNNFTLDGANSNWAASGSTNTGIVNAFVPPTAAIQGGATICIGQSRTLTNTIPGGSWTSSNTGVATINATTGQVTTVSAGTTTITYTTACGGVSTLNFTVNPLPTPAIAGTNTICSGGSTTLTASGGNTYSWNTGATTAAITVSPTVTTTYTATVTNVNGCTAQASRTVTVNVKPDVTASSNSPVSTGNNLQLSANGAFSYSWSGPNGFNSTAQNPVINNITSAANGTYTVTGTSILGCTNTASVNVTVLSTPATALKTDGVDDHVTISNPFRAFNKEITVEFWMNTPTGKLAQGSIMGQSSLNVDGMGTDVWLMHPDIGGTNLDFYVNDAGTWRRATVPIRAGGWHHYVGVASEFGIKFYVDGVLEQTGPAISTGILNNANAIMQIGKDPRHTNFRFADMSIDEVRVWSRALCEAEIINNKNCELNPTGQTGLQEYYRFNQGFVGANNSTETTLTDLSGNNRHGLLSGFGLTGNNSNWIESGFVSTANCSPYVAPSAPIVGNTSLCIGGNSTLSNTITGGLWSSSNTAIATINANTGVVNAFSAGTTTITYRTECGGVSTATITVNTFPVASISGINTTCLGGSTTLTASGGGTYLWNTGATTASINVSPTVATTYSVTVTSAAGCVSTANRTVTVNPTPTVTASSNSPIIAGDNLQLSSTGATTYSWTGPNGFTSAVQNPVITTATTTASGVYTVTGTNASGCSNTATVNVTVQAKPATALNTDGVDDYVVINNPFRAFNKEITVEFWMNTPNAIMPYGSVMGQATSGVDNMSTNVWLMHPNTTGGIDFLVNDAGTWRGATVPIKAGGWHHYVGVASEFGTRFYVDGVLEATGPAITTGIVNNPNSVIHIGKDVRHNTGRFGNITVDEVRIWSRVLCESEINNSKNCELNPSGLMGLQQYYRFNQGFVDANNSSVTALVDASGNGRDGQLNDFTLTGANSNWVASGSTNNGTCSNYVPPTAPITGTTYICIGSTSTLSNAIPGGLWSSSNPSVATINANTGLVTSVSAGVTTITYKNECGGISTTTVSTPNLPTPTITTPVGGTSVCPGNTVTLSAPSGFGIRYQWYKDGVEIPGATSSNYTATVSGTYTLARTSIPCVSTQSSPVIVTIADDVKPSITCPPNQTIDLDANCKAILPDYRSLLTVSDNCTPTGSLTITQSPAAGSEINDKGSMIVAFTVRDAAGNESTCTITLTKKDVTAPVITCPAPIIVNNTANTCGAVVNFINPTATDNCTGGAFNFWSGGEPNNFQNANEDYVQLYTSGRWNDLPNSSLNRFIVEFNDIRSTVYSGYTLIGTYGGHTYYISTGSATWTASRSAAQAIGGDLASINTLGESSFLAPYGGNTWVGGYQDKSVPGFREPGNASQNYLGWKWVDGTQLGAGQIIITQTAGLPSGSVFPVGVTTNTFVARDESGNESTCSFTVTVRDVQPPVITCQANINVTATSADGVVVNYTTPVGTDNCSGVTTIRTAGLASGSTFPIGTTTVTYRVTDAAGLSTQCSFTVTVVGVAPVITCPANITVNAATGTCAANVNFAATETVGIPASTITYTINGNPVVSGASFPVGTTTVVATATNAVGSSSCSFTVTVVDNEKPTITAPANVQGNNTTGLCTGTVTLGTPVTADNCGVASVDSDAPATFPVGTTTVTWTVTDIHGNTNTATQTVTIRDNEKPTITAPANVQGNNTAGLCTGTVTLGTPVTADNCGVASVDDDAPSVFPVGTTTVTWTVTDIHGNTNTATQTVTIRDNEKPTITAPANVQGNNTAGLCTGTVTLGTPVTADNCGVASVDNDAPSVFPVGTTVVTWTVTDIHGNAATATQTVVIVDHEKPTISTSNISVNNDPTKCGASVSISQPTTADNCGVLAVMGIRSDNELLTADYPVGTTTITWTVRDIHGNTNTTTQTVIVNDTELPVVKTQNIIAQLGANGQVSITASQINNGSTDNCAIATVVLDKVNFNCSNVGQNTVLLTVTDIHGNSASGTATVTVQDNIRPTVITQPVTVTLINGAASVTAAQVNNGSFDNCGIATITVSPANFNCNNIGSNTVILTVTDVNGNTNTASATVTVVGQLPSCSITSVPTSNVFTGGNPNNIYLGYGAQSTVLNVAATGGSSYTYQWSGTATQMLSSITAAAPVFTPTAPGNYTFTVTVTNNFGCTSTCSITICVKDIRVPGTGLKGSPAKVYICHLPPGNKNNPQTLEISVNAVATHIGQHSGDRLGTCAMTPCPEPAPATVSNALISKAVVESESKADTNEELKVTVMPNPSATYFTLKLESKYAAPVNLRVMDALGRVVDNRQKLGSNSTVEVGHNYQSGTYFAEFIQGNRRRVVQLLKIKR